MSGMLTISTRSIRRNVLRITTDLIDSNNSKVLKSGLSTKAIQKQCVSRFTKSTNGNFSRTKVLTKWSHHDRLLHTTSALQESRVINVPPFADSVSEGDVKLDKKVGEYVRVDEVVMEIETDKTSVPVPAPAGGLIEEILVKDGDTVKAGQALFKLNTDAAPPAGGAPPKAAPPPPKPTPAIPPPIPRAPSPPPRAVKPPAPPVTRPPVPPVAKPIPIKPPVVKLPVSSAAKPTAPSVGKPAPPPPAPPRPGPPRPIPPPVPPKPPIIVTPPKAPAAASPKPASPPPPSTPAQPKAAPPSTPPPTPPKPSAPSAQIPVAAMRHAQAIDTATIKMPPQDPTKEITGTRTEQRVKMNRMRLKIASRLKEAQNTNAMLTTFNEIDMSAIMQFRKDHLDAFVKKYGIKLGFMSAFCKASAYALQDQPVVNAVIDGGEIIYRDYIDISVAVATPKGLVVPVLRNVESMNFADIELAINELGVKAKKGAITVEDMDGGTFTISNGGVFGSLMGTPIINPPQSSILGMHGTFERPIAIKGQVVVRPMMYVALTYDHRLIDGREAVLFLRKIKAAVEDPRVILAGL